MSNEGGLSEMEALAAKLRELASPDLDEEIAREAAPEVEKIIRATAAAGTDPDGKPWEPKKDGGKALVGIEKDISAKAIGDLVVVTLTGGGAYHHLSKGKKTRPQRKVLPDGGAGLPENIEAAVKKAMDKVIARKMSG